MSGLVHEEVPKGELCGICKRERGDDVIATHKVGEETDAYQRKQMKFTGPSPSKEEIKEWNRVYGSRFRHNWTQYVCCEHFGLIMGPAVKEWCNQ